MMNEITKTRVNEINEDLVKIHDNSWLVWNANARIGERLHIIKSGFNGNTKEFGDWLKQYCPKLDVKMVSYHIKLAGYNENQYSSDTIIEWLKANAINATNPRSCWDKFNKAHTEETPKDEKNGDVEKIEPLGSESKDSLVARLAQIYDEFKKRANELDENEIDTIDTITHQFKDVIASLEAEEAKTE